MSVRVMTWVWDHSRAGGSDRLVLLAIADCASDDGSEAWPATATLARKTRVDERTVQRCVQRLVELGELEVMWRSGPRGTNRYRVRMTPRQSVTPGNLPPGTVSPHPRQIAASTPGTLSPEPSLNRPEPASKPARPTAKIDPKIVGLQQALAAANMPVIPPKDEITCRRIVELVDRIGTTALLTSAWAQWQPANPARYMTAFVAEWTELAPKTAAAATRKCPSHELRLSAAGVCSGCEADRKAAR